MSFGPPRLPAEEPDNPYSAPTLSYGRKPHHFEAAAPREISIEEIFSRSWAIFKEQMGTCVGVMLVANLIIAGGYIAFFVAILAVTAISKDSPLAIGAVVVFGMLAFFVFVIWITLGSMLFYLNVAKGRKSGFGDLFAAGKYMLPVVGAAIVIMSIFLALWIVGGLGPAALVFAITEGGSSVQIGAIVLWCCAVAFLSIAIGLRFSQSTNLILDDRSGALDSLRMSYELTRGRALQVLAIFLLTIPINVLGELACGIGLLFTAPYTYLLLAVTYVALTGQPIADPTGEYQKPPPPLIDDDFV